MHAVCAVVAGFRGVATTHEAHALQQVAHDVVQLRVGVENLTDEDPPIFPSYSQANTDPSQYDVLGRRYYMSLRYSF